MGRGLAAGDADDARHHYAEARGAGLACLLDDPVFDARQAELGWDAAVDALPDDREGCAVWTVFAWLRWMEQVGPRAAELDFARINPLIDELRVRRVDPEGRLTWSRGLSQTLQDRANGLSSPRGRALLAQAVEVDPGDLARTADLLLLTEAEIAGESRDALERARRSSPDTPEDVRALERLGSL
ncbi:MAG: hypothetical protein EP330_03250 [Deltaproteobacteria bacterium]|nr:MAG: hypothetical protein EP330_03250 [Deltaproteobacteria bacterium]